MNLLDEIFSASSYKQTQTTTGNQNSTVSNILDFASLSSNNNNNTQQTQSKTLTAANQGNLFDMIGNNKPAAEGLKKPDFVPVQMNTDSFGEYWTNCPTDEKSLDFVSKYVNSPQKFFDVVKSSGNFFPVEIIDDQAIACAKLKDKLVLVHATISGFNVNVLVKCFDNAQIDLVARFLKEFI